MMGRAMHAALFLGALTSPASAGAPVRFGPNDVRSVTFVAKSENKNEVHYAVSLDATCQPSSPSPLWPYWKQRERDENATDPLLSFEQRAYGIKSQRVEGTRIYARLRAIDRELIVETWRGPHGCEARALMPIDRTPATLHSVYVKLGFPFRVEYLLLQGRALADGRVVRERLSS